MAGFWLHSGNRLETLAVLLAERLADGRRDPFVAETVVIQSRGMERWVNMALADAVGVSANLKYPFPRNFIQNYLFAPLLGRDVSAGTDYFSVDAMTWRIAALLPDMLRQSGFEPLRRYLDGAGNPVMKLSQLSAIIADRFDKYLLYRPKMMLDWGAGRNPMAGCPDSRWQMKLWRKLAAGREAEHFASLWDRSCALLTDGSDHAAMFPELVRLERVAFFGFSSLTPALMDLVLAAARVIDVDFYYLNPSAAFWQHNEPYRRVISKVGQELARVVERAGLRSLPDLDELEAMLHFDTGNALLGAWGEQGREFFSLLADRELESADEAFHQWGDDDDGCELTLLQRLQNDILTLSMPEEKLSVVARDDDSLMIHSCHNLMREVEVLFENLTGIFLRHPDILPGDVVVMTPDIEAYAPFFEAVFRSRSLSDPRWAFSSIADRSSLAALPEVKAFRQILLLARERYRVSAVLAVLDCEAVRSRFGLSERDLELVRRWLCDTAVNWGIDAASRQACGDVAFEENSWRHGLDRMMAGFAMSTAERTGLDPLWRTPGGTGLWPYDQIENDGESILGRLCNFTEKVFAVERRIAELETASAAPSDWRDFLMAAISDFLPDEADCYEAVNALRGAVNGVMEDLMAAGFDLARRDPALQLTFDLLLPRLESRLGDQSSGGFLLGGITFCAVKPLRNVPAKVVCLLGMDESVFPRGDQGVSFDLMRRQPFFGDRSARNDDRYFFLESLLSARRCFYISYQGQSDKDNTPVPPSVLVDELKDYIVRYYGWDDGTAITGDGFTVRQPLQAFSRRYFDASCGAVRSWSSENYAVAVRIAAGKSGQMPCTPVVLDIDPAAVPEPDDVITLDMLAEFIANPAGYFCRRRLGIDLEVRDATMPEDREKFAIDHLDGYKLAHYLVEHYLPHFRADWNPALVKECYSQFKVRGMLPPEMSGQVAFEQFFREFYPYGARLAQLAGELLPPVQAQLTVSDVPQPFHVSLPQLYRRYDGQGVVQLFCRYSSRTGKEKELLKARLAHLALGLPAVREQLAVGGAVTTRYEFRNDVVVLDAVPAADTALTNMAGLLELYRLGRQHPLEFVPEPSLKYWQALRNPEKSEADRWSETAAAWSDWWSDRTGGVDPYVSFCFGPELPDDAAFRERFAACAERVYSLIGEA